MIYILEVPHQMPATYWTVNDRAQLVSVTLQSAAQHRRAADIESYADAVEYLGDDLHELRIYDTDADALSAYIDDDGLDQPARDLALKLWQEQIASGIGDAEEPADDTNLGEWLANRTYPLDKLLEAAHGHVDALAEVRSEAGLPTLS